MMKFLKSKLLLITSAITLGLFGWTHKSHAFISIITEPLRVLVSLLIFFIVGTGISFGILALSSAILAWVSSPDFVKFSYTNNVMVTSGWTVVRDFTNLLFLLVMVFIGIATALRWKDYQAQKTLPKLIIVAILINFSPVICGVVIDASNIVMNFFLTAAPAGYGKLLSTVKTAADLLGGAFQGIFTSGGRNLINGVFFMQTLFVMAYNFITSFVFLMMAGLFIVRSIALLILIIFSPLAFFAFILPGTRSLGRKWASQFVQWCFVGVTGAFFLYLSQLLIKNVGNQMFQQPVNMLSDSAITLKGEMSTMMLMSIPIIFLAAGAFVTMSTSAMGANIITSGARKLSRYGLTKAGAVTKDRAKGLGRAALARVPRGIDRTMQRLATKGDFRWGQDMTGVRGTLARGSTKVVNALVTPTSRRLGQGWRIVTANKLGATQEETALKMAEKSVEGKSVDDYAYKISKNANPAEIAGFLAQAIKDKKFKQLWERKDELIGDKKMGKVFEVLTRNPNLKSQKESIERQLVDDDKSLGILTSAINKVTETERVDKKTGVVIDKPGLTLDESKKYDNYKDKVLKEMKAQDVEELPTKLSNNLEKDIVNSIVKAGGGSMQKVAALYKKYGDQIVAAIQTKLDEMKESVFEIDEEKKDTKGNLLLIRQIASSPAAKDIGLRINLGGDEKLNEKIDKAQRALVSFRRNLPPEGEQQKSDEELKGGSEDFGPVNKEGEENDDYVGGTDDFNG